MSDETEKVPAAVEAALARIEGMIDSGFARITGRVDLVLQRADQTDARIHDLTAAISDHERRIRDQEVRAATRDDVKALDGRVDAAVTKDELDGRFRRTTAIMTIVVAVVGIVVSAGVALLIALAL